MIAFVDAHESDVEPRLDFMRYPALMQPDHAFIVQTGANGEDRAGAVARAGNLVAEEDGHPVPGVCLAAIGIDAWRVEARWLHSRPNAAIVYGCATRARGMGVG